MNINFDLAFLLLETLKAKPVDVEAFCDKVGAQQQDNNIRT